jgi:3-deoxy-D-manno-octulosonic-acid transferase
MRFASALSPIEISVQALKPSLLLSAYRLASAGLGAAGPLYLYWRGKIGRDDFLRRHERLGRSYLARPGGRLALLHMASGADTLGAKALAEKLVQLGFTVLLSIRDPKFGTFQAPRFPLSLHQLSPLDTPQSVTRFLDHWRPDIVLLSGPEIRPILIFEANRREVPLALVNARVSARSFLIWRGFLGFSASLLSRLDIALAQTNADAERLRALGARSVRVTGSLKYDVAPAPADQFALARLVARIGTRPAWVADGIALSEKEIVITAHRHLARQFSNILTVIVPDNPKHAFEIAQTAAQMGFIAGIRGADRETAPFPDIYIAHTADEAGLFYRGAGVVFVGKSLSRGGGKNPVQAAQLGCAILHGPEIDEFEDLFAALDNSGGGMLVFDADTLAKQLALLFFDKAELRSMARAAAETAEFFGGASTLTIEAIAPYIAQVMVAPKAIGG